jgi:hypothetical protein
MSGVWQVEVRQPRRFWRRYRLTAVAQEGDDSFRLECSWAECLFLLTVYKNGSSEEDVIFRRLLFADADLDKHVARIMRIARRNVGNRLARLDPRYKDGVLG